MAESLITQHIDLWTSAIEAKSTAGRGSKNKFDLYGIKKLRELILELAVRGKLVPQDPSDEPADMILQHINHENKHLIEKGILKKLKSLSPVTEDELPFEVPGGWAWVRLGTLGVIASSSRVHQKDWKISGVPFYRAREIVLLSKNGIVDNELFISEELYDELITSGFIPEKNDIMLTGVGTIGIPYIVKATDRFYFKDASVLIFKNMAKLNTEFLGEYFLSPLWNSQIHEGSMGTTVHTLTIGRANDILVPLPPQAEQLRIVAKVDELMALCDQLEQQTLTSIDAHATLVETLLETLTNSADAAELEQNWARTSEHFDTLFTTEQSIDALKQTILKLAVMGKLVRQDPTDEPASVLLEKIAAEKAQLIKDKKIKKEKPLPPISDDEKPFELPQGWEWCRFEDVVDIQSGITKGRSLSGRELTTVKYLAVANVQRGYLQLDGLKEIELPVDELEKYRVINNDLLITEGGDWDKVGRTAIWRDEIPYVAHQNHVFKARVFIEAQSETWLEIYLNSPFAREYFAGSSKQTTNLASINKTQLRGCLIAVPMLREKEQIVKRLQQLWGVCEQLKLNINKCSQTQKCFTDALIDNALR